MKWIPLIATMVLSVCQGLYGSNGCNAPKEGVRGPTGPTGATGPIGPQGPEGLAGQNGENGQNGFSGATGPTGATGPIGPDGPASTAAGPAGAVGISGGFAHHLFNFTGGVNQRVLSGGAVAFLETPLVYGTSITQTSTTEFVISQPGNYLVDFVCYFYVNGTQNFRGFALAIDGVVPPNAPKTPFRAAAPTEIINTGVLSHIVCVDTPPVTLSVVNTDTNPQWVGGEVDLVLNTTASINILQLSPPGCP